MNTACEIGCRMWRSSRCGRAATLFAKLLKQTTSNYFTKSNLSVTVSQRHRQLSAARCGRATTLFAKLLKQTTLLVITSPKVICQSLWARDIDTCRKRSSTILWESGSKSAGEPNPRLGRVYTTIGPRIWLPTFDVIILEAIVYKVNEGIQIRGGSKSALRVIQIR